MPHFTVFMLSANFCWGLAWISSLSNSSGQLIQHIHMVLLIYVLVSSRDFLAVLWFHGSQALSGGEELWDLETRPGLAVCFSVCSLKSELLDGRVSLRFCSLLPWWQIVALNGPYWELPEATSCFQFCCLGSWDFLFLWFTNLACDVGCSFFQQLNVLAPLLAPLSIQHSLFLFMTKCPTVYCFLNPPWPLLASQFFLEFWLTFSFRSIDT